MKRGQCKLCLQIKDLCKESHIIPSFLYKLLAGKNSLLVFLDKIAARFRYNGEYERNILCENCDNQIIGKLDDYAAKFIHNEFPQKLNSRIEVINGHEYLVIENDPNYDYKKYKLFLLSLLWRSSIASRPFFQQLKLSSSVEDDLRQMILSSNPGEPERYASFVFLPPLVSAPGGGRGFNTFYMPTMSPIMAKNNDWEICKFIVEGMMFFFLISAPPGTKVEPSTRKDKLLLKISTPEEQSEVHKLIFEMVRNHKR
ncbi:MAG: hypothetical protein WC435_00220 [Candidatus Paceibacterota bacterium]